MSLQYLSTDIALQALLRDRSLVVLRALRTLWSLEIRHVEATITGTQDENKCYADLFHEGTFIADIHQWLAP